MAYNIISIEGAKAWYLDGDEVITVGIKKEPLEASDSDCIYIDTNEKMVTRSPDLKNKDLNLVRVQIEFPRWIQEKRVQAKVDPSKVVVGQGKPVEHEFNYNFLPIKDLKLGMICKDSQGDGFALKIFEIDLVTQKTFELGADKRLIKFKNPSLVNLTKLRPDNK